MTESKKLYFASHNTHKIEEINAVLNTYWEVKSLRDLGITTPIPETGTTIEENAALKASFLYDRFQVGCFADDSGLEVDALNGAPGVFSARYAGDDKNDLDNTIKLLDALKDTVNRSAQFKTGICYIDSHGVKHTFEGIVRGQITASPKGSGGFGYDPVFIPEGYTITFAEMSAEEKNQISHRGIAVRKLVEFLTIKPKNK